MERQEIVKRTAAVLAKLELLSEAPVMSFTGPASGAKPKAGSRRPNNSGSSEFAYQVRGLVRWLEGAEKAVEHKQKGLADRNGQIPPLTAAQKRCRLIESGNFVGVGHERAAKKLDLDPLDVWLTREKNRKDPKTGHPAKGLVA